MDNPTSATFQLWTHHPSTLPLTDPALQIDPTKGMYWIHETDMGLRYREAWAKLVVTLKESNFLWCCTVPGQFQRMTAKDDLVEWELNVPDSQIVAWMNNPVWEKLIRDLDHSWDGLILPKSPTGDLAEYVALVRVPIEPAWATRRELKPKYPR